MAATKVLSVHWLGTTLRFAAMTCTSVGKPENQRYSYTVSLTDLVSTKTVALLRESEATEPLIALRTDPHGRYLAIMPRAGGLQVPYYYYCCYYYCCCCCCYCFCCWYPITATATTTAAAAALAVVLPSVLVLGVADPRQ